MITPEISIGLPVYNGEKHLRRAVDSILAQDFEDFELIIVDNASTDQTAEIARDYAARDPRVRFERNETNIGAGPNHNRVAALARGRYFRWTADDIECLPGALRRCFEVLRDAPQEIVMVYPRCEMIDVAGAHGEVRMHSLESNDSRPHRRLAHVIHHIWWVTQLFGLIRSDVLRKTRLIDSFASSDYVLLAELAMLGQLREIPETLNRRWLEPGRGAAAQSRKRGWAEWLDPKRGKGDWLPYHQRLAWEYFRSAYRMPLKMGDRLRCMIAGPGTHYRRIFLRKTGPFRHWLRNALHRPHLVN